jgi:uncharacterized membrane protein
VRKGFVEGTTEPREQRRISWKARIDLALGAILLGGLFWSFHESALERQEAIQRYGHTVDAGAYVALIGMLFLLPMGLLFLTAGIGLWRGWRIARFLHWLAVIASVLLVVLGYRVLLFSFLITMDFLRHR